MKIKSIKCQVENEQGGIEEKFVDFDVFMTHLAQIMSESGHWKEPQIARVRAKGNWEGLYLRDE